MKFYVLRLVDWLPNAVSILVGYAPNGYKVSMGP
jgi:hypothetical protein